MAGGAATATGMRFQDTVAAWFAVRVVAESAAAPLAGLPDDTTLDFLLAETVQPTDDLNVGTSAHGRLFIQAKSSLSLSMGEESEFRKVIDQFVRQMVHGGPHGEGHRPFDTTHDRLVLVVSSAAPATIREDLRTVLQRLESASTTTLPDILGAMGGRDRAAHDTLRALFDAHWADHSGSSSTDADFLAFARAMRILVLDLSPDGADMRAADELLRNAVLHDPAQAGAAWTKITGFCCNLSPERTGADREYLRRLLLNAGFHLAPPRSHQDGIDHARQYSEERLRFLRKLSVIRFADAPGGEIKIEREAQVELTAMARDGHVVVIGEPGAGKSGCIHDVAMALGVDHDTLVIPIDRVADASDLHKELGLTRARTLAELLRNWSGPDPAYLFIDALDAARTKGSLQRLCEDLEAIMEQAPRWRIVTSIREFDLQHSRDAQRLFQGTPHAHLRSARFPGVRHIQVRRLDDASLGSVADQATALGNAIALGGPSLKCLARNLFNLRLLAELVEALGEGALTPITTQLELLNLYWTQRVERPGSKPALRRQLLSRAVEAMRLSRRLTTPKPPLLHNAAEDGPCFEQLLSDGILVETAAPVSGASQDISFAHNILFDYAVARLWLQDIPTDVLEELADPNHDDLLLAVRPSIDMAFSRLWHEPHQDDRELFWARTFEFQRTRLVGRIIPAAVAASTFNQSADIARLIDAVVADAEHAVRILGYMVTAAAMMDEDDGTEYALLGREAAEWMELASTLAKRALPRVAWQVRTLLANAMQAHDRLTSRERYFAGDAARRLLRLALDEPKCRGVMPIVMPVVCQTADTNPAGSVEVLAPFLEPNEIAECGYQTLEYMTEHLGTFIRADPEFALRLATTTFSTHASRDEKVPMGNRLVPLTFNKRDMLDMARRHVSNCFPAIMQFDPIIGIRIAGRVLAEHSKHSQSGGLPEGSHQFDFAGGQATLQVDRSHIWADQSYVTHEAWWRVLRALYEGIRAVATESSDRIPAMLAAFRESFQLAAGWNILLEAAAATPASLGVAVSELLTVRAVLEEADTRIAAGKLIQNVYGFIGPETRAAIEGVVMQLGEATGDSIPNEYFEHRRDRVLGCIPLELIATEPARKRLEQLTAASAVPTNERERFEGLRQVSEDERMAEEGIDIAAPQNQRIREQTETVKSFKPADPQQRLSAAEIEAFLATANKFADDIQAAQTLGIDPQLAKAAREYFIECCERMARAEGLTPNHAAFPLIRTTLLEAVDDPVPVPSDDDDRWDTGMPSWSSPSPRISAAIGLMALAGNSEAIDDDIRSSITALLNDPHPAVRFQIARRCFMLWEADRSLAWQLIDHIAKNERRMAILSFFMNDVLLRLGRDDLQRADSLIRLIYRRTRRDGRASKVRGLAASFFLRRTLRDVDRRSARRLDVYVDKPLQYSSELGRIITLCRGLLVHDRPEDSAEENARVRSWAVQFLRRALESVLQHLRTLREQHMGAAEWPEHAANEFRALHSLADDIGNQVYFASGAFAERQDDDIGILSPVQLARFAEEIDPLLDLLCEVEFVHIAYDVLKLLQHLAPQRPSRVFQLLGKLVSSASRDGIHYESMATDLVVEIVEQYLADRRNLFLDPEMRRTLLSVLDHFVEAGWPNAARLTFRLSEVFR